MKKTTKRKISKFENIVKLIALFLVVAGPVSIVFAKSSLSAVNYKLEKVKKGISIQEKTNESLDMKINELASLENIQEVIKEQGLTYNNNNIKSIE